MISSSFKENLTSIVVESGEVNDGGNLFGDL